MNWRTEIAFCPELSPNNGGGDGVCRGFITGLLARHLFNASNQARKLLTARYRQMQENCQDVPHDDPRWNLRFGTETIHGNRNDEAALLPVTRETMGNCGPLVSELWDHEDFGHDMPTWMVKRGVENPRRVMIIAQDPRRTNQGRGNLVLSTPFGFHSADYRDIHCQNAKLYRLVERLLDEANACVYLTDCKKFYTSDGFVKDNKEQLYGMFNATLQAEIAAFAPDVILTLGNIAAEFCHISLPRNGYSVQKGGGRNFVAAYHTGVRANYVMPFIPENAEHPILAYFDLVFEEVRRVLGSSRNSSVAD